MSVSQIMNSSGQINVPINTNLITVGNIIPANPSAAVPIGNLNEYFEEVLASGANIPTDNAYHSLTAINLAQGNWMCYGAVTSEMVTPNAILLVQGLISLSNTAPLSNEFQYLTVFQPNGSAPSQQASLVLAPRYISVPSGGATIYLLAKSDAISGVSDIPVAGYIDVIRQM
jgi:hypothetical protein